MTSTKTATARTLSRLGRVRSLRTLLPYSPCHWALACSLLASAIAASSAASPCPSPPVPFSSPSSRLLDNVTTRQTSSKGARTQIGSPSAFDRKETCCTVTFQAMSCSGSRRSSQLASSSSSFVSFLPRASSPRSSPPLFAFTAAYLGLPFAVVLFASEPR
ncbi:hypothetical protein EXIGLDRAFT_199068 [Exidia glandulosa HHB12029]|uniref:Transmembrane protein n=1 Tax=Exidia glandulosa HHB12029 TaxID=1314781 RepID=A0A165MXZ8_EXIGL|nr:hypothetical protein EXIGLDRAFT_199068 [Exidia glandulosa HHB12029]